MRLKSVTLSWFRGAANSAALEANGKSVVIYGENASGKSSFVDAVEHAINGGKIGHLSHEESGERQERAIPNTHTPTDQKTSYAIKFLNGDEFSVRIKKDGAWTKSDKNNTALDTWNYRCTILRQDEVAAFIHDTKGQKYTALLPLLGLQHLENTAENLRKLTRSIEQQSHLDQKKGALSQLSSRRKAQFGDDDDNAILKRLELLYSAYCPTQTAPTDKTELCKEILTALNERISNSTLDQRQHIALMEIASIEFKPDVEAIREKSAKLAAAAEPLIEERLEVLEAAKSFASQITGKDSISCPACGQDVAVDNFKQHLSTEKERLEDIIRVYNEQNTAITRLSDNIKKLKSLLTKSEIKPWS